LLVLSRKKNESIRIRDDVTVTVVSIHGDKVRLGIEAPQEVPILRDDARRREPRGSDAVAGVAGDAGPVHRAEVWERIHAAEIRGAGGREDR